MHYLIHPMTPSPGVPMHIFIQVPFLYQVLPTQRDLWIPHLGPSTQDCLSERKTREEGRVMGSESYTHLNSVLNVTPSGRMSQGEKNTGITINILPWADCQCPSRQPSCAINMVYRAEIIDKTFNYPEKEHVSQIYLLVLSTISSSGGLSAS